MSCEDYLAKNSIETNKFHNINCVTLKLSLTSIITTTQLHPIQWARHLKYFIFTNTVTTNRKAVNNRTAIQDSTWQLDSLIAADVEINSFRQDDMGEKDSIV